MKRTGLGPKTEGRGWEEQSCARADHNYGKNAAIERETGVNGGGIGSDIHINIDSESENESESDKYDIKRRLPERIVLPQLRYFRIRPTTHDPENEIHTGAKVPAARDPLTVPLSAPTLAAPLDDEEERVRVTIAQIAQELSICNGGVMNGDVINDGVLSAEYKEIGTVSLRPEKVDWLPEYLRAFSLPHDARVKGLSAYREARIAALDGASMFAVHTLLSSSSVPPCTGLALATCAAQPLRFLDLCCAPGSKLLACLDLLPAKSSVVAVDNSPHRLRTTQRTLLRHGYIAATSRHETNISENGGTSANRVASRKDHDIHLLEADGRSFDVTNPHTFRLLHRRPRVKGSQDPHTHTAENRLERLARLTQFDLVCVDVECTLDGSTRHLVKHQISEPSNPDQGPQGPLCNKRYLDAWSQDRLRELPSLQLGLLQKGFDCIKEGGRVLYSTCSMDARQNEQIVLKLLENNPGRAVPLPVKMPSLQGVLNVPFGRKATDKLDRKVPDLVKSTDEIHRQIQSSGNGILFSPAHQTLTSGLFIALIAKVPIVSGARGAGGDDGRRAQGGHQEEREEEGEEKGEGEFGHRR